MSASTFCAACSHNRAACPRLAYCSKGWYRYFFWGAILAFASAALLIVGARYGIERFVTGAFSVSTAPPRQGQDRDESIELRFNNLVVRKGSKTLIDGASGQFSRGKVLCPHI